MPLNLTLSRRYSLPALHVLGAEGCSEEENRRIFGGCSRLHGHDYQVEVTVAGPVDPGTGWIVSRDHLDQAVRTALIEPYTGRNLSRYFRHTTGEALCVEFIRLLRERLPAGASLVRLTVHETAKNSFSAGPRG